MIDKKKLVYVGIGIFFLLVLFNSSKDVQLNEVSEKAPELKNFDNASLPLELKPPIKLSDKEPMPNAARPKKNLNGLTLMPRFDL